MKAKIAAGILALLGLSVWQRHFFCKRGWHVLHTLGNERGFYYYCGLCSFVIEGGNHLNNVMDDHDEPEEQCDHEHHFACPRCEQYLRYDEINEIYWCDDCDLWYE